MPGQRLTPTVDPLGLAAPDGMASHALPDLVRGHRRTFGWYDQLLADRGLDDTTPLAELPMLDEELLTEHYYTADHADLPGASAYLTSGTSSGRRKRIVWSPEDHDLYVAQRRDLFARFLADVPEGAVAVGDLGTGHAAASAHEIFEQLGFEAHDIDFARPIDEHVELLERWQPDVLFTMPMVLDRLLARPEQPAISPRKVIVVGDVAPANWRRHVAQRFGIRYEDVLDVLGSIEIGAIAWFCAETGLYHFHDHILPEALTPEEVYGTPAELPPGGGILLLTSFARSYLPALRYVTGDVVIGVRTIPYRGSWVHAFERIDSRFSGDVKHGERVSAHDLCAAVNHVLPGVVFEVATTGGMEIRVVADQVTDDQADAIRRHLLEACPDVGQMTRSGLVAEIVVRAIGMEELRSGHGKRLFNISEP